MRKAAYILFIICLITGCKKEKMPDVSGTVTIDNILYGSGPYYALGFCFSTAGTISTLSKNPKHDLTIGNDGTLLNLILQSENFNDSFYRAGDYPDEGSAKQAFDNLTAPSVPQWIVWADSVKANQIWIYRSGTEHFAKIRIISTVSEVRSGRNYAECTFEWRYQPDGSLTFPSK